MPPSIEEFSLIKQEQNIDIVLYLNDFMIIIEDKTSSKSHSGQLMRYKNYAEKKMAVKM